MIGHTTTGRHTIVDHASAVRYLVARRGDLLAQAEANLDLAASFNSCGDVERATILIERARVLFAQSERLAPA